MTTIPFTETINIEINPKIKKSFSTSKNDVNEYISHQRGL